MLYLANMDTMTIAILGGLGSAVGYGLADVFAKKGIDEVGHNQSLVFIYAFSVLFTLPFLLLDATWPNFSSRTWLNLAAFAAADFVAYTALYKAYEIGKVSIINPITSTYAILAAIISAIFFQETFGSLKIIALALVMAGIALASVDLKELKDGLQTKDLAKGLPLAVLIFTIYGIYVPFLDQFLAQDGWVILTLVERFFIFLLGLFWAKGIKKINLKIERRQAWLALVMVGLLEGVAAMSFNWGISASDQTTVVSALGSAYPLFLTIGAYFFLKEKLAINQYLGTALIVTGVVLVSFA